MFFPYLNHYIVSIQLIKQQRKLRNAQICDAHDNSRV